MLPSSSSTAGAETLGREHSGEDTVGEPSEVAQRFAHVVLGVRHVRVMVGKAATGEGEVKRGADESLLGAVVEVAFDAPRAGRRTLRRPHVVHRRRSCADGDERGRQRVSELVDVQGCTHIGFSQYQHRGHAPSWPAVGDRQAWSRLATSQPWIRRTTSDVRCTSPIGPPGARPTRPRTTSSFAPLAGRTATLVRGGRDHGVPDLDGRTDEVVSVTVA